MQALATNRAGREAAKAAPTPSGQAPAPVQAAPVNLDERQRAVVAQRMELLGPLMAFEHGGVVAFEGRAVSSLREIVKRHAAETGSSEATLWRMWRDSERGSNPEALAPKPRKDRGVTFRRVKHPQRLKRFIKAQMRSTLSAAHITDLVREQHPGVNISYSAVSRFIKSIPPASREFVSEPRRVWDTRNAPYLVTGLQEHYRAYEALVADNRPFDVRVWNDGHFAHVKYGAVLRIHQTCIEDMHTRAVVGYTLHDTPSSDTIGAALKLSIRAYGLPQKVIMDNGKDFQKIGVALAGLGIAVQHCIVRNARAKPVESFFSFVSKRFDRVFFRHGYTGARAGTRPDRTVELEKQHKEFLAGARPASPLVPASAFVKLYARWVEKFNHQRAHPAIGKPPMQLMEEEHPRAQRVIPPMAQLAPLFWSPTLCKVARCKVRANKRTYSAHWEDEQGQIEMYRANSITVVVRCDPYDLDYAVAFEQGPSGKLIAALVSDQAAIREHPPTKDMVKAITRNRRRFARAERETWEAETRGEMTALDLLAQEAGVSLHQPARAPRRIARVSQYPEELAAAVGKEE